MVNYITGVYVESTEHLKRSFLRKWLSAKRLHVLLGSEYASVSDITWKKVFQTCNLLEITKTHCLFVFKCLIFHEEGKKVIFETTSLITILSFHQRYFERPLKVKLFNQGHV